MKVFRFMSIIEFRLYLSGNILKNEKDHHLINNSRTNSKGFCFMSLKDFKPEEAFHFLTGIICPEICAVFETEKKNLNKCWGRYALPLHNMTHEDILKAIMGLNDKFIATEYCTTEYSKSNFKLIKYTIPDWFNWDNWKWKEFTYELQATKRNQEQNVERDKTV